MLAINAVGESSLSPSVTILGAVAPSQPKDFEVTASAAGTIDVAWTAPAYDGGSPLTGYYGYHKLSSAGTFTQSALIDPDTTTYQFTGVGDSEYVVKVVAVNSEDESDPTDSIYQFASAVPITLGVPTVDDSTRTSTSMKIEWTAPGTSTLDIIGYQLYINDADSNADPSTLIYDGSSIPGTLSATIYNLQSGSTYNFAYAALNGAGWSDLSDSLTVTAGNLPSPPSSAP